MEKSRVLLKEEEIEESGERFLDAKSLDELRGGAEEKQMARAFVIPNSPIRTSGSPEPKEE